MGLGKNNNQKVITRLATNSIKGSRLRNIFIILTMILTTGLIMGMGTFTLGMRKSEQRKVQGMQQVMYMDITKEQMKALAEREEINVLKQYKTGTGIELDNKIMQISYLPDENLIGDAGAITTADVLEGHLPETMYEAALPKGLCKLLGVEAKLGEEVTVTYPDDSTETFTITGLIEWAEPASIYSLYVSEAYAEAGAHLSEAPYSALVCIEGAEQMSESQFLDLIRRIGEECGIPRKSVNENNSFVGNLKGSSMQQQETMVMVIVGIGILFVSVLVIYSIFYLAVVGRIRQFGQLRTVGMTRRQIKKMIRKEGLLLCAYGVPVGLLIGGLIGYLIRPDGWYWPNTLIMAVIATAATTITVLLSVQKPGKIAATISPVEAAKYSGYLNGGGKATETKVLCRKLTTMNLARMSMNRNRRKSILTMISLGIGGVLFLLAATYTKSTNLEQYARQAEFSLGEFAIDLSKNAAETEELGMTGLQIQEPFNEELQQSIRSIDGVEKVIPLKNFFVNWEANGETSRESIVTFSEDEITDEDLESGSIDYEHMAKNNEIVIYNNDVVEEIFGWKYKVGDKLKFSYFDGEAVKEREFTVAAITKKQYVFDHVINGWYLVTDEVYQEMTGSVDTTAELVIKVKEGAYDQVEEQLKPIVDEQPLFIMTGLKERMEEGEASFKVIFGMILGLSLFIIAFSLINLVNTLITNVVTRKREFAMLKSIGMTDKQVGKMINMEGLLLAGGNMLITLVLGVPASIAFINAFRSMGIKYMHYSFPIWYMLGYAAVIVGVPLLISTMANREFKKQSLVERLRIED